MIQIITYDINKYANYSKEVYVISKLGEIQALDDFELCVVDLANKTLWENKDNSTHMISSYKDLLTVKKALKNSNKSEILIVFPQNYEFYYNYGWSGNYNKSTYRGVTLLKDMTKNLMEIITSNLLNAEKTTLEFEKSKTIINGKEIVADFNFVFCDDSEFETITFSKNSNKITTIKKDRILLTTLNLFQSDDILKLFIDNYCKESKKEEIPDWINDIKFFNDEKLMEDKSKNIEEIEKIKEKNMEIDKCLEENLEYKSILYTNAEELVKVVMKILDEILEYDSTCFIDEKREDFQIKKEDVTFIGEIKGLSSAVKNENVSQLDVHVQSYNDKLQSENIQENVKGLLIINHQRKKPLGKREQVHEYQVKLAKRNGSLIIETITLLKLYEKYKLGGITKEECKNLFKDKTGVLEI